MGVDIYPPLSSGGGTAVQNVYHAQLLANATRTSTATKTNEPTLSFTNLLAGTYLWDAQIRSASTNVNNGPDIQLLLTPSPTTSTALYLIVPMNYNSTAISPSGFPVADLQNSTIGMGADGVSQNNTLFVRGRFVITATSTFAFNWSQQSSNATPVLLLPYSSMTLTKIA